MDQTELNINSFLKEHFDDFQTFPLAGDASSRRYFRIVVQSTKQSTASKDTEPEAFVLMVWEPYTSDNNYPFLSVLNYFQEKGISVPKVIAESPEKGLILLEDLGDLTLERKFWSNQDQKSVIPFYQQALDQLYKIHFHTISDNKENCTALRVAFDHKKFLWEMNYTLRNLVNEFCKIKLTDSQLDIFNKTFDSICHRLDDEKKFIAHRDYHSRNVMIKLGQCKIIDFQDARLGPIQYDLVSLLRDSYVNLDPAIQSELLKSYFDRATEEKYITQPHEEFMKTYELQTIQRCFKACGSFSSFYNSREDTRYLRHISNTITQVKSSLMLFSEYKNFHDILNDYGLFERDYLNP